MSKMEKHLRDKAWEEKMRERGAIAQGIRERIPEFRFLGEPLVKVPFRCRLDWIFTGWWMHSQVRIGKHSILPGDRSLYMCVRCGKVSTVYCWGGVDSGGCKREYWGYADPNVIREVSEV